MVLWPKDGICRNLTNKSMNLRLSIIIINFPLVKFIEHQWIYCRQDAKQMCEQCFPNAQLKFVKQINNQYVKKVKAQGLQPFGKSVLVGSQNDGAQEMEEFLLMLEQVILPSRCVLLQRC